MAKSVNLIHLLLFFVLYVAAWPNLLSQGSGEAASPISTVLTPNAGPRTPSGDDSTAVKEAIAKVYAGNPGSPTTSNGHASSNAVSQYDVACKNVSTQVP